MEEIFQVHINFMLTHSTLQLKQGLLFALYGTPNYMTWELTYLKLY